MTSPPVPTLPISPEQKSRPFLISGLLAVLFTAVAAPFGLFTGVPGIGGLLRRGGLVGTVAIVTVAVTLWVVLFCLLRLGLGRRERTQLRLLWFRRAQFDARQAALRSTDRLETITGSISTNTMLGRRMAALRGGDGIDRSGLATRSELDHARGDVSYLPARALVWALPALGFLGTAAEMSRAIGGLGDSVMATEEYKALRDSLISEVIPPLGDAFGITLFALGAAVVCHLLLTWTNAWDQRVLLDIEDAVVELLDELPPVRAGGVGIVGDLGGLTRELASTREAMLESALTVSSMDLSRLASLRDLGKLAPLLEEANRRLDAISGELNRD